MRKVKLTVRERDLLCWLEQAAQQKPVSPDQRLFEETFKCSPKPRKKQKQSPNIFAALSQGVAAAARHVDAAERIRVPAILLSPLG